MSESPPIRRLSTTSSSSPGNLKREENLINAYEAEEERIINVLSRKLEQLREDKIHLENVLEAENESHVNRLTRELSALRLAQQQQQQQQQYGQQQSQAQINGAGPSSFNGSSMYAGSGISNGINGLGSTSPDTRVGMQMFMSGQPPLSPSAEVMLDAMRRENEHLRTRLVETERDYVRILRLNEIYREELIEHRRRLGLSVDNLVGLSSSLDPFSQPTHRRSFSSNVSSPSASASYSNPASQLHSQSQATGSTRLPPSFAPTHSVPIPRPPSQIHRPVTDQPYLSPEATTPLSHSPSSSSIESPFPFSPITATNPASLMSTETHMTTPPSSASLQSNPEAGAYGRMMMGTPAQGLSYPSVPPPSLSSSFGSPVISYVSRSPVEPLSRRNSNAQRRSVDRGGRIAETGTLVPRSRAESHTGAGSGLAATAEDVGENRGGRL